MDTPALDGASHVAHRIRLRAEEAVEDGGGVLSNFPIRLIATSDAFTKEIMGSSTDPAGAGNLGPLIDENLPVPGAPNQPQPPVSVGNLRTIHASPAWSTR